MATNWPNSVQTFTNPSAGDSLNSPSHSAQHTTVNDTVEALQQYAGLVLVKTQTIGSAVSSVTVTGAFSSTFDNYQVICAGVSSSSSVANCLVTVGSKTSGYYGAGTRTVYNSASVSVMNRSNGSDWYAGEFANSRAGHRTLTFCNPNTTGFPVSFQAQGVGGGYSTFFMGDGGSATTNYTSFTLAPSTGTITGGTIRVYGYNNG